MNANSLVHSIPPTVNEHVAQLAALLFRIMRSCNVSAELLVEHLSNLLDSQVEESETDAIWTSADVHLACTEVVFFWRRDARFLDSDGNPRALPRAGTEASFSSLCEKAAPGRAPEQLLEYLARMGTIKLLPDGSLSLITESVLACTTGPGSTVAPETVLMHLQGFLGTVEFNLLRRSGDACPRFERACYGDIPARLVPVFRQLVATRGQNYIDSIDEWIERHRVEAGCGLPVTRVGSGAYMLLHDSAKIE